MSLTFFWILIKAYHCEYIQIYYDEMLKCTIDHESKIFLTNVFWKFLWQNESQSFLTWGLIRVFFYSIILLVLFYIKFIDSPNIFISNGVNRVFTYVESFENKLNSKCAEFKLKKLLVHSKYSYLTVMWLFWQYYHIFFDVTVAARTCIWICAI